MIKNTKQGKAYRSYWILGDSGIFLLRSCQAVFQTCLPRMLPGCSMMFPPYLGNSTKPSRCQHPLRLGNLHLLFCKYVWVLFVRRFIYLCASSFQKDFKVEASALSTLTMQHKVLLRTLFLLFTSTFSRLPCPSCSLPQLQSVPVVIWQNLYLHLNHAVDWVYHTLSLFKIFLWVNLISLVRL